MPTNIQPKPDPSPAEQRRRFLAAALESGANERDAETALRAAEEGLAALEASLKASDCPEGNLDAAPK